MPRERDLYVRRVLDQYRQLPGTLGHLRRTDRRLAEQLHARSVPLSLVEAAFTLATCRRLFRAADAQPLEPVRTLHYYLAVIEELREHPVDPDYLRYLQGKLATFRARPAPETADRTPPPNHSDADLTPRRTR
jgi:hypothetical protein